MSSLPPIPTNSESPFQRLNKFLDQHLLPYPVKFLTNRVIILATLALLVLLIFFTGDQSFVNALNSYLNVMSLVVSSTVLLYATIADVRDRAAAERREEIAKSYEQVLEKRVQAEHELIQQILQNSIQNILLHRLEKIRAEDQKRAEEMQRAVIVRNKELHQGELAQLTALVQTLSQSYFGKSPNSQS
ncbi:MAG: hypothetical protein ABI700_05100 [Chloroflexota bacterium]